MQLVDRRGGQARATGTQRVAQRNGAAVGVHARIVVSQAEHAQHGQALGGKRFIQLDHVHLRQRQTGQCQHFLGGGCGTNAHDARGDTRRGHADNAGTRNEAVFGCGGLVSQQQGTGPVVHAAGVAGGHAAVRAHHAFELGQ